VCGCGCVGSHRNNLQRKMESGKWKVENETQYILQTLH
jgi:hypothetical protein